MTLSSCDQPKKSKSRTPNLNEKKATSRDTEGSTQNVETQKKETSEKPDCIFDVSAQNDDFLKGIGELEGYHWNPETKTAFIRISKTETLDIFRGGCDHFSMKATFSVSKDLTLEKNQKDLFDKIIWVSSLLYNQIDSQAIKKALSEGKYSLDEISDESTTMHLMDQKLYKNYVIHYDSGNDRYNQFSINYHLN